MFQPLRPAHERRPGTPPRLWRFGLSIFGLALTLGGTVAVVGQDVVPPGAPPPPLPGVKLDVPAEPMPAPQLNAAPMNDPAAEGEEVLTRGPLHEAFAQPMNIGREAPPLVEKQPPAAIEELPPDEKPEGDNVMWIPGYWAWDDDRNDFLWVSGVYRDVPPNQAWVAGYWSQVAGGYQWVPGFWTAQKADEVEFLPEPPASLDEGPTTAQPSDNHFWVVGNWRHVNNRYAWTPGYWTAAQPGWIWSPAYYSWSPYGYCYTGGFWDYTLAQRGCAFAPVYFGPRYFARPYAYTPGIVLRTNFLTVHLWSRPRYNHYYFGDYYGGGFVNAGYRPWFSPVVANRPCYDPLFTYYSWQGRRGDPNWSNVVRQRHDYLVANAGYRPPHTYAAMRDLARDPRVQQNITNVNIINSRNTDIDIVNANGRGRGPGRGDREFGKFDGDLTSLQVQNAAFADNIDRVARQVRDVPNAPVKFEKVDAQARERYSRQATDFRDMAVQRQKFDAAAIAAASRPGNAKAGGTVDPTPGKGGPNVAVDGGTKMKFQPVRPTRDGRNPVTVAKPDADDGLPGRNPNRDPNDRGPNGGRNPLGDVGKAADPDGPLMPGRNNPLDGKNPDRGVGKNPDVTGGKNPTDSRVGRDRPDPLDIPGKNPNMGKGRPRTDDVVRPGGSTPDVTDVIPGKNPTTRDVPDPTFPGRNPNPNADNPFPGTRKIGDLPPNGKTPNVDPTPGANPMNPNADNPFPGTRKIGDLPPNGTTPNVDPTPGKNPRNMNTDNPFPGTRKIGDLPTGPFPGNTVQGRDSTNKDTPRPPRVDTPRNNPNVTPGIDLPKANPNPTPRPPELRNNPTPRGNLNPGGNPVPVPRMTPGAAPKAGPKANVAPSPVNPGGGNPGVVPGAGGGKGKGADLFRPQPRIEDPTPRVNPMPKMDRRETRPVSAPVIDRPEPKIERPAPRIEKPTPPPRVERAAPPKVDRPAPTPRAERPAGNAADRPAFRGEKPGRNPGEDKKKK
ncbi:MAG: hypothetical protein QM811_08745 [Pirellulales bacterium]